MLKLTKKEQLEEVFKRLLKYYFKNETDYRINSLIKNLISEVTIRTNII